MTVPRPRARPASMKLQTAGMIEANAEACSTTGRSSVRGRMHGTSRIGTSCMWSRRWSAERSTRACSGLGVEPRRPRPSMPSVR